MPKISQEQREGRRLQILEAAWRCFYRKGLHAATMQEIILASGLSAGAVYLYFPSKEEIILTAIRTSLTVLRTELFKLLEKDDYNSLPQLVERMTISIDKFAARDGYDMRSIALLGWSEAQTNAHVRETMVPLYRKFLSQLRAAVKRSRSRGIADRNASVDATTEVLLSILLGNVVQSALLGTNPVRRIAKGIAGMVSNNCSN